MQNKIVKEYAMTEQTINGARKMQSNKAFRKQLASANLLIDYDVLFIAMDYIAKTGLKVSMAPQEMDSCRKLLQEVEKAYCGDIKVGELNSMQNFARLTHYQALLLNNLSKREAVIKNLDPKKRKDKKLCKRLVDEYENLWAILGSRVVKNYYDYASTRDGYEKGVISEQEYIGSQSDVVVGGVNLSKVLKSLYRDKFSKTYVVNNLPEREEVFKRELPKVVKENKTVFNRATKGIYVDMVKDITSNRKFEAYTGGVHNEPDVKASKLGKRIAAGALSAVLLANSLAGPVSQIAKQFESDKPGVTTPDQPDNPNIDEIITPEEDRWNGNAIITDDPNTVAPNVSEDSEKPADNIGSFEEDDDLTNDTVLPDLAPGDNTDVFNPNDSENSGEDTKEESPSVDHDSPNEKPVVSGDKDNEKSETEGSADDRDDNFWIMN